MLGDLFANSVLAVLSTYLIYEYFTTFFEAGDKKTTNKIVMGLYCIWQISSLTILGGIPAWFRLLLSNFLVIVVAFCFSVDFWGKVVFAIIYNSIWFLSELLTGSFFLLMGLSIEKYEILGSALSKLLLLLLIKMLRKFYNHDGLNVLSWKENALLMVLPIGSMFLTNHLFSLSLRVGTQSEIIISLVAFFAILMINTVMFIVYIKLSDSLELKSKNSIFQLEIDLYNEHMKEKEHAMLEFRKSKHDLKNKLIFLLELVRDKKYDEMEGYIEELVDLKSLEGFTIAHSDNSLIDALINYKYETAKQHGIQFHVKLDIPIRFPLANADLCVILGNALDNAIEANIGADIDNPFINLKMKYAQGNLVIFLENSFDGQMKRDRKGNIITKKQDKDNHGIGITSMQNALVKYNGFMKTEIEDKVYKLTIVMYDTDEKNI